MLEESVLIHPDFSYAFVFFNTLSGQIRVDFVHTISVTVEIVLISSVDSVVLIIRLVSHQIFGRE